MDSSKSKDPTVRIADVFGFVRRKGVRLWAEDGHLHYKAPKGALTQEEIEILRASKDELVALFGTATDTVTVEPRIELRRRTEPVPLTFSQLSHWHRYQLEERSHLRQIASATRLCGRLNLDALRRSVAEMVCRHEALRTRIVLVDGVPMQEICESGRSEVEFDDLTTLPKSFREAEVPRLIEQFILQPIDVTMGPLFGVKLLRLSDNEHVLIVAMEHLISDGFSGNILLSDLFTAYRQASSGRAFSLPAIPVQFADYAVWQRNSQPLWLEKHDAYWKKRLAGCRRVRFPVDKDQPAGTRLGWGTVPVHIGRDLRAELSEWCRRRRTTLVMSIFTAYVALVSRWCNTSDVVIRYVTDGRISPKLQNTIGYFAFQLSVRIELTANDSFCTLMNRVSEEYCRAYERAGSGYLEAQMPRPEFARNSAFNWVPRGSEFDRSASDAPDDPLTCSPISFEHPMLRSLDWDSEPFILLYEAKDEIAGGMHFPLSRLPIDTMERFARNFLTVITALLRQPDQRVKDILLL